MIGYVFGFVTLCLSAVLMFQGMIAKSADSLAMRGIKFAVGQFVPFVGGAVNEALSTIMGGIGKIRTATGVFGAVIVCLIAAMPVIRVLLHKMFLELVSVCAGILGLPSENKLMGDVSGFLGYTAAVMAISSVFFVLSLSMMASIG
jgi:stage III sporulation protein AE